VQKGGLCSKGLGLGSLFGTREERWALHSCEQSKLNTSERIGAERTLHEEER